MVDVVELALVGVRGAGGGGKCVLGAAGEGLVEEFAGVTKPDEVGGGAKTDGRCGLVETGGDVTLGAA